MPRAVEVVRSSSNRLLRRLRAVSRGKTPEAIVLEGERLVEEALRLGITPELVLVAERTAGAGARLARRGVESLILNGLEPGCLTRALVGEPVGGTTVRARSS